VIGAPAAMRALILHNPGAGSGQVAGADLVAALRAGGLAPHYCSSKSPDVLEALRERPDLVVVAGGDGTVIKAIAHCREWHLPIAILPLGGANNIARSLGIAGNPIEIAREDWRRTDVQRLDLGSAIGPWGERLFVEAVGVGVLAEAAAAVDAAGIQGSERLHRAREVLQARLASADPQEVRLTVDGEEVAISCLLMEIMNAASIGPQLLLAPAAQPGDGLLDLVWLEAAARPAMLSWLEREEGAPPLATRQGRSFSFAWRQGWVHVDDVFHQPPAQPCTIEAKLLPGPVTVVMPADIGFRR
jgi:diacylglycerol kinase (ATP)